jgi:hypothetical protein
VTALSRAQARAQTGDSLNVRELDLGHMTAGLVRDLKCPPFYAAPAIVMTLFDHFARDHECMPSRSGIAAKHVPLRIGNYCLSPHNVEEIAWHAKATASTDERLLYVYVPCLIQTQGRYLQTVHASSDCVTATTPG